MVSASADERVVAGDIQAKLCAIVLAGQERAKQMSEVLKSFSTQVLATAIEANVIEQFLQSLPTRRKSRYTTSRIRCGLSPTFHTPIPIASYARNLRQTI